MGANPSVFYDGIWNVAPDYKNAIKMQKVIYRFDFVVDVNDFEVWFITLCPNII